MVLEKLQVLGGGASWDSCGGVKQKGFRKAKIPADFANFIHDCSATSEKCRLMKLLQSNKCIHDCRYCVNSTNRHKKVELEPMELAKSFNAIERKGWVDGLFLSSAVTGNAERITEKMIESARIVRGKFGFKGYIHLKVLPTAPKEQIFEMAELADRLSLNMEVPSKGHFSELGSTKDYMNDLQKRLFWIDEAKRKGKLGSFTTQLILGAADETDGEVLRKMDWLYDRTMLHRTYFSAFEPVKGTKLEEKPAENSGREHVLYQSDWLLRVYGFGLEEVKSALNEGGNLKLGADVKFTVAMNNHGLFPLDPNEASRQELLHVPGIGPKAAEKIIGERDRKKLVEFKHLKEMGIIYKRAQPFLQLQNERQARISEF